MSTDSLCRPHPEATGLSLSGHLNLPSLSPVNHLVCLLTWIHLPLLPIHQLASACPPRVPVCLVSATLPIRHTVHLPTLVPHSPVTTKEECGLCGHHSLSWPRLNITTCRFRVPMVPRHPAPSSFPEAPSLAGSKGFYLRNQISCHVPSAKNVQAVPKEITGHKREGVCTRMLTAKLFVIAKGWEQPKCPTVGAGRVNYGQPHDGGLDSY